MILIFGGTTEGKISADLCASSGSAFVYSTKGESSVRWSNSLSIWGELNFTQMAHICISNKISLIINAAHPFATNLHNNISRVSYLLKIPVIRFERKFKEKIDEALYFKEEKELISYLSTSSYNKILLLTGVSSVKKYKELWKKRDVWIRVMDRADSNQEIEIGGFPKSRVLYFKDNSIEQQREIFKKIKPNVIVIKESGESSGFYNKCTAAQEEKIAICILSKRELPDFYKPDELDFDGNIVVNGPLSLREMIDRILPGFFKLRVGITTGTCAVGASMACLRDIFEKRVQDWIEIMLPAGECIKIKAEFVSKGDNWCEYRVQKYSGDDPDVLNGIYIHSRVRVDSYFSDINNNRRITIDGGDGVGRVTLPGLGIDVGSAAINQKPKDSLLENINSYLNSFDKEDYLDNLKIEVIISAPKGVELASKTFNPKLGIERGISIIGTSGIVKPFSSEAFVASFCKEIDLSVALGCNSIILNSGAKSEKIVRSIFNKSCERSFVQIGNYVGSALEYIDKKQEITNIIVVLMVGKAVKLAQGRMDTHSKESLFDREFIKALAVKSGCDRSVINYIENLNFARDLWFINDKDQRDLLMQAIADSSLSYCRKTVKDREISFYLISEDGSYYVSNTP